MCCTCKKFTDNFSFIEVGCAMWVCYSERVPPQSNDNYNFHQECQNGAVCKQFMQLSQIWARQPTNFTSPDAHMMFQPRLLKTHEYAKRGGL